MTQSKRKLITSERKPANQHTLNIQEVDEARGHIAKGYEIAKLDVNVSKTEATPTRTQPALVQSNKTEEGRRGLSHSLEIALTAEPPTSKSQGFYASLVYQTETQGAQHWPPK